MSARWITYFTYPRKYFTHMLVMAPRCLIHATGGGGGMTSNDTGTAPQTPTTTQPNTSPPSDTQRDKGGTEGGQEKGGTTGGTDTTSGSSGDTGRKGEGSSSP
jgi:hypothetical protein